MLGVGILEKTKIRLFAASASVWTEMKSRHTPQLEERDEEEDEFHDFRSEHSSGYNTPEAEPSALDFTAEKLFRIMEDGFYGCSVDVTRHSNNHHGLEALFSDPTFPSILSLSE